MARQRLRPDKTYTPADLKAGQKVFREFCGDNSVMMEPFSAADLCAKIAQAIAHERERCASIAQHLNGWGNPPAPDLAAHIAKVIRDAVGAPHD